MELMKRITLKDKKGKIVFDSGIQPSQSYVLQFLQIICAIITFHGSPDPSIRDTDAQYQQLGSTNIWDSGDYPFSIHGGSGEEYWGLVVGTGDMAEDNENYRLESKIAHGTGAGELEHGGTSYNSPAVNGAGTYYQWHIYRTFANNSGGSIEVKEIGAQVRYTNSPANKYALIWRDLLSPTITIPDGQTLTVNYYLRIPVV